jgi:hypothetical protein
VADPGAHPAVKAEAPVPGGRYTQLEQAGILHHLDMRLPAAVCPAGPENKDVFRVLVRNQLNVNQWRQKLMVVNGVDNATTLTYGTRDAVVVELFNTCPFA